MFGILISIFSYRREDSEIEIKFCGEQLEAIQMGELSFLFQLYEGMTLRHVRAMHWPIIPGDVSILDSSL